MGQFNYVTTLDQVMGHYATQVDETDQTHLEIIAPWQIYVCNALLQRIKIAVDFYQRETVQLNSGLDRVKILLDDTDVLGRNTFDEHVE